MTDFEDYKTVYQDNYEKIYGYKIEVSIKGKWVLIGDFAPRRMLKKAFIRAAKRMETDANFK